MSGPADCPQRIGKPGLRGLNGFRVIPGLALAASLFVAAFPGSAGAWPLDGYPDTGIGRLEHDRLVVAGELDGRPPPPGARLPTAAIDLRLTGHAELDLPEPDPGFTAALRDLLGENQADYALAVLDLTDPDAIAYAEWRGDYRQNVGSVGKLVAALGLFQALADAWPGDTQRRWELLRDTPVTADDFSQRDHHTVRFYDPATGAGERRAIEIADEASLFTYLDWMVSVSSNSAAAMIMREAMLLHAQGQAYPPPNASIDPFFDDLGSSGRTALFQDTFWDALERNGFDLDKFRQGSFFTQGGKARVNGGGNSYATVRSLALFALRLEQGRLVDEWSSRQLKRALYLTERRIRYASSPRLDEAAVWFKSGSLYSCKEEPGFDCGAYRGNVRNYMNSLAIVEQEVDGRRVHYVSALISNKLRENAAVAHQALGGDVHDLILARHAGD